MAQNTDSDDSSTMVTRRNVLIGLGVTGAGTLAVLDNFTDVLEGTSGSGIGQENPPLTNPNDGADDSAFQTPWDADSLVITIEWNDEDAVDTGWFGDFAYEQLRTAVAFWNDYIGANAAFDLTLTFEQNHNNPDILLNQESVLNYECGPEYTGPGSQNENWSSEVCLETVRETPADDDLPITATIGPCGSGRGVYRLIVQHAIGRLLGYDIWSDPVSVMNPKILISPAHPINSAIYRLPYGVYNRARATLEITDEERTAKLENPQSDTKGALEGVLQSLNQEVDDQNLDDWVAEIDEAVRDVYAEAYEETIVNDEIAYMEETAALISDVLDTYTQSEIADGPDELDTIHDRVVTIQNWPGEPEPYDVQIHRYVTDEVWSAWAAEQTPTATDTPTTTDSA